MVYLHDALASVFPEVVRIGPLKSTREPVGVVRRLASWTKKLDHPLWLTQASAKGMARQVEARLEEIKPETEGFLARFVSKTTGVRNFVVKLGPVTCSDKP